MVMRTILLLILLLLATPVMANADFWSRSYALEAKGEFGSALDALNRPGGQADGELLLLRRGWLNYLLGKYAESLQNYQRALALNPNSLDAKLGLILPLLASKKWDEAAIAAKRVLAISPWQFSAASYLLAAEEGQKNWPALRSHAADLASRYPSATLPLLYLARANAKLGKKAEASAAYQRLLARYPGHPEATEYLAKR